MACQFNKMLFCLSERYIYEINKLLSGVANVFTFLRTGTSDKQTHSTTFMNEGSSKILKRLGTRFGEISTLWQNFKSLGKFLDGFFNIWHFRLLVKLPLL